MRLTSYSNYTLRVLMVAAARTPALTTIQEVADGFGVSKAHLVKCVHQLGAWGYLETVRGNGGGFRLARPAEAIPVGEVVRRTEDGFVLVECFDPTTNTCPLVDGCRLRRVLVRATEAFLGVLDEVSVADLVEDGDELLGLIDLEPAAACGRGGRRQPA